MRTAPSIHGILHKGGIKDVLVWLRNRQKELVTLVKSYKELE